MSVETIVTGQTGDLHKLLEALNDLSSGPSRPNTNIKHLGLVHDSDQSWNHMPTPQEIHVVVVVYGRRMSGTQEFDFQSNDSLCDELDQEANWKRYVRLSATCSGVRSLNLDLTDRPYPEIKSMIDMWGQSLFAIPNSGIAKICVYMR